MFFRLTGLVMGLLFISTLTAQNLDDIFDDGKVADPFGAVKVDLLNLYAGEALVGVEYYISQRFAVVALAGPRIGDYRPAIFESLTNGSEEGLTLETDGGFNYVFEFKFTNNYWDDSGYFYGLSYHGRSFTVANNDDALRVSEFGFFAGYRLPIGARFHLEADFRTLLRSTNDNFDQEYQQLSGSGGSFDDTLPQFAGEINLRAGYAF